MKRIETGIQGLYILEPKVFGDNRGYFLESYNQATLKGLGIETVFCQDNQSYSHYGVIRGLHFQRPPYTQTKLVRCLRGRVYDVAVDLRAGSATYGKYVGVELSADNFRQLYIPAGFAHGFSVLSEDAILFYKCDAYYHPEAEDGLAYNDKTLGIDWQIPEDKRVLSDKDTKYKGIAEITPIEI